MSNMNRGERMKVVVTGSNGFIGRNVCRWLKNNTDWSICGLGRRAQPVDLVDEYAQCDLDNGDDVARLEREYLHNVDAVIHLAADMRREPHNVEVVAANCVGTQRVLEACERAEIKTFMQLSSLPVIGTPIQHPITEKHPLRPPTVYHATKIAEEFLAGYADYARGIRTASFRICAPIGIGVKQTTIFPTFARRAVAGENIVLYGKGTRKQTYIHVDDIAQALYKSIISDRAHGVYNLASENLISNYELARMCIDAAASSSKIQFADYPDNEEGLIWDVSIERLKADTDFMPLIEIGDCVREQIEYYETHLQGKER